MEIAPGKTILITGDGVVARAAVALALWRGAMPIVAGQRRLEGIEHFIDTSARDVREAVLELTDGAWC